MILLAHGVLTSEVREPLLQMISVGLLFSYMKGAMHPTFEEDEGRIYICTFNMYWRLGEKGKRLY